MRASAALIEVAVAPERPVGEEKPEEGAVAGRLAGHAGARKTSPRRAAQPDAERLQAVERRRASSPASSRAPPSC